MTVTVSGMSEAATRSLGPQRRRCGIGAALLLFAAFSSFGLHAESADGVRSQIQGMLVAASATLNHAAVAHGESRALWSQ
jgi:hypothetical protein